jgi:hypothetical protein
MIGFHRAGNVAGSDVACGPDLTVLTQRMSMSAASVRELGTADLSRSAGERGGGDTCVSALSSAWMKGKIMGIVAVDCWEGGGGRESAPLC